MTTLSATLQHFARDGGSNLADVLNAVQDDDEQPVEEKCRHGIPLDETCEDCADESLEQWYNMDK